MKDPTNADRDINGTQLRNSCQVILEAGSWRISLNSFLADEVKDTYVCAIISEITNTPMSSGTNDRPSSSSKTPMVIRVSPVIVSMPIRATKPPKSVDIIPFITDSPTTDPITTNAIT